MDKKQNQNDLNESQDNVKKSSSKSQLSNFWDIIKLILFKPSFQLISSWLIFIGFLIGSIALLAASTVSWGGAGVMLAFTVVLSFETVWITLKVRK